MRLLTNNPAKCEALEELGIKVVERIPVVTEPNEENYKYLLTKQKRMGHLLGLTPRPSPLLVRGRYRLFTLATAVSMAWRASSSPPPSASHLAVRI